MNRLAQQISEICKESGETWITVNDIALQTGAPIQRCLAEMEAHSLLSDEGDGTWKITYPDPKPPEVSTESAKKRTPSEPEKKNTFDSDRGKLVDPNANSPWVLPNSPWSLPEHLGETSAVVNSEDEAESLISRLESIESKIDELPKKIESAVRLLSKRKDALAPRARKRYSMTQMLDDGVIALDDEVQVVGSKAKAKISSGLFVVTTRGHRVRTLQWVKQHAKSCGTRMHGHLLHTRSGRTIEELRKNALDAGE